LKVQQKIKEKWEGPNWHDCKMQKRIYKTWKRSDGSTRRTIVKTGYLL
jgi:hypothetical protein